MVHGAVRSRPTPQITICLISKFKTMEMKDFIVGCLGFGCLDTKFDEYCDAFGIDFDDDDVTDALRACHPNYGSFGGEMYYILFNKIIDKYHREPLDRDLWDYCINGDASSLYYDGDEIFAPADLDCLIRELKGEE